MLEAKVRHMKEQNRTLRMMLETMSRKWQKLQLHVQEINNAQGCRQSFSTAQKPSRIFVKTHPNDNSVVCTLTTCVNAQIYNEVDAFIKI